MSSGREIGPRNRLSLLKGWQFKMDNNCSHIQLYTVYMYLCHQKVKKCFGVTSTGYQKGVVESVTDRPGHSSDVHHLRETVSDGGAIAYHGHQHPSLFNPRTLNKMSSVTFRGQ